MISFHCPRCGPEQALDRHGPARSDGHVRWQARRCRSCGLEASVIEVLVLGSTVAIDVKELLNSGGEDERDLGDHRRAKMRRS